MDNLVLSNLFHRPARTLVSVLGIGIGVLLITFTVGMANGSLRERARREASINAELLVHASGSLGLSGSESFRLPTSWAKEITQIDGVQLAVPLGQHNVEDAKTNAGTRLTDGINFDEYVPISGLQIVQGQGLALSGDEAIIDTAWQKQRKLKLGDTVRTYERDFKIVGIYEPAVGARIKIPLSTMQEQLGSNDKCSSILVKLSDPAKLDEVGQKILEQYPDKVQVIKTKELEDLYLSSVPALNVFLNVVIGVACVISALVILLTMYTTVTERTRQIGILKSLGMSKTGIAWTITQEALLISFLGAICGVLLMLLTRQIVINTTSLQVFIEVPWIIITFFVALIGGALGALYPALRAANLDAVEALSYE
jgi:putative ABC transport system permease protein